MSDIEQRLSELERRLSTIESLVGASPAPVSASPSPSTTAKPTTPILTKIQPGQSNQSSKPERIDSKARQSSIEADRSWSVTNILGWGGMTAIVWAAAYMVRLAIDSGWLTPTLQVFSVILIAVCLIGAGLRLRESNHEYAGLLPAAGIVILFLSVYGAHLLLSIDLRDDRRRGHNIRVHCFPVVVLDIPKSPLRIICCRWLLLCTFHATGTRKRHNGSCDLLFCLESYCFAPFQFGSGTDRSICLHYIWG